MKDRNKENSEREWAFSEFPSGQLGLRKLLGPVILDLLECRLGWPLPDHVQNALFSISMLLIELVDDDELGLIGVSPEDRASFAAHLEDKQW